VEGHHWRSLREGGSRGDVATAMGYLDSAELTRDVVLELWVNIHRELLSDSRGDL
jgi:hypothetical protein